MGGEAGRTPLVWVLSSGRAGDDQQSRRLAAGLGWPCEEKRIVFRPEMQVGDALRGPTLGSVDLEASSPLAAPWPDLVISAGWRQVPVVRWVRERSEGRARLVQFNRPPCIEHFDLVLAAPQYGMPARANVLPLDLPLQEPGDPAARKAAAELWAPRLAALPRPWTVLLLGGSTWPLRLDAEVARRTFDTALARATERGGSLLVTTSRRTPPDAVAAVREAAVEVSSAANDGQGAGCFFFAWDPQATENPYLAFLELGDEFVVTADSVSMLVEVVRLGRPLAVQSLPRRRSLRKSTLAALKRALHGAPGASQGALRTRVSERASALGLKFERDLDRVAERFIERGWAARFPAAPCARKGPVPDDLERAVAAVRRLFEGERAAG